MPTLYLYPGYTRGDIPDDFWEYTDEQYSIVLMDKYKSNYIRYVSKKPKSGDLVMRAPDDWAIRKTNGAKPKWKNWDYMGTIYRFVFPDDEDYVGKSKCFKTRFNTHINSNPQFLKLGLNAQEKVEITTWRVPLDQLDHYERIFIHFFPSSLNVCLNNTQKFSANRKQELVLQAEGGSMSIIQAKRDANLAVVKAKAEAVARKRDAKLAVVKAKAEAAARKQAEAAVKRDAKLALVKANEEAKQKKAVVVANRKRKRQYDKDINRKIGKVRFKCNKWEAEIKIAKTDIYLGRYSTKEEARAACHAASQRAVAAAKTRLTE